MDRTADMFSGSINPFIPETMDERFVTVLISSTLQLKARAPFFTSDCLPSISVFL